MPSMTDQLIQQISKDLDDFHRYLQKDNEELKKMTPIFVGFQKSAVGASEAVKGIVSGAGGSAWSTFTGSIQLVGMQLARFFIPALVAASQVAQDFAQWLEDMSPETREVLMSFAKLAAGAAAVYLAINVLSNPMVWLAGAVIAAVAALKMLPDIIEWIRKKLPPEVGMFAAVGQAGLTIALQKALGFGGVLAAGARAGATVATGVDPKELASDFSKMISESMKKNLGFNFGDVGKLFGVGEEAKKREPRRLLFDFVKEMQPRFSSVEEARKQFQISALKSPLEQEMMRYQRQMAQDFVAETAKRNKAWDVLGGLANFFGFR